MSFHILLISKMRPRGVKETSQRQTAIKQWSQNSKPGSLLPKSMGFTTILCIPKQNQDTAMHPSELREASWDRIKMLRRNTPDV